MPSLIVSNARPLKEAFKYFWMKSVSGFNPAQHCARCLVGPYVEQVGLGMPLDQDVMIDAAEGDVFYLCGVSMPFRRDNNLHFALRANESAAAQIDLYSGGCVNAVGFERIAFTDAVARAQYAGKAAAFLTCRNFQFGAQEFAL